MIGNDKIIQIGVFAKPHGIHGEITAVLDIDFEDLKNLRCIILKIDGINVPFFLKNIRPKGRDTALLSIDGYNSESDIREFTNAPIYALKDEVPENSPEDEDGFYISDFIGYDILDVQGHPVGAIIAFDDSTENVLLVVRRPDGTQVYVPVADEFFIEINPETKTIIMDLPEGLLAL